MKQEVIFYNQLLCERYPFLVLRNVWTDKIIEGYDCSFTELDYMPQGWRIAFGEKLCEEIREELIKYNYLDKYRISQIKEKYGELRIYDFGAPQSVHDIINKYTNISRKTCIVCGAPATRIETGWISPYCDNHTTEKESIPIEEYYKGE